MKAFFRGAGRAFLGLVVSFTGWHSKGAIKRDSGVPESPMKSQKWKARSYWFQGTQGSSLAFPGLSIFVYFPLLCVSTFLAPEIFKELPGVPGTSGVSRELQGAGSPEYLQGVENKKVTSGKLESPDIQENDETRDASEN